jgi:hypothetical protein
MFRWWFVAIVVGAMLSQFAPAAFADGCEGGDSTAGHNAITFCCGKGDQDKGDRHGRGHRSVVISGLRAR